MVTIPKMKGISISGTLVENILLLVMYITLSGIKSNIENDNIMVAEIDKNKGMYSHLFNLGINMNTEPKSVPKPAKIDNR